MQEVNVKLLNLLNDLSHYESVELFVKIFVDGPIFMLPLFLCGYWIYYSFNSKQSKQENNKQKSNLLLIFYGVAFSLILSLIIQQIVEVDRPEQHLQAGAKLLLDHLPDASFPSDHATVSIAFLTGVLLSGYKKWFYIFLGLFICMNISRIIAGVHWPFDIIGGSLVGILGTYLVFGHISQIKFVKKMNLWIITLLNAIKL